METVADACREIASIDHRKSDIHGYNIEELKSISEYFSAKIPDSCFSPAEVQAFLQLEERRCDPRTALDEIDAWVVTTQAEKEKKAQEVEDEKEARARKNAVKKGRKRGQEEEGEGKGDGSCRENLGREAPAHDCRDSGQRARAWQG